MQLYGVDDQLILIFLENLRLNAIDLALGGDHEAIIAAVFLILKITGEDRFAAITKICRASVILKG